MKNIFFLWLPSIIWASVIFIFSSQPYDQQNIRPILTEVMPEEQLEQIFSHVVISYAGKPISIHTVGTVGFLEFFIRKGAHFIVFFILGWVVYRALKFMLTSQNVYPVILSFFLVSLYAATDEYHQHFTENRTPLMEDVFLDMSGGASGIIFAMLYMKKVGNLSGFNHKVNN